MSRRFTIRRVILAGVCLAAATLAAGYALAAAWPWAATSLALGALWLAGQWRRWPLAAPLGFAASVALAAFSLWLDTGIPMALLGLLAVVAALCAWDLDGLAQRLERYPFVGDQARLEGQHLHRLLAVAALSLLLAIAALAFQLRLTLLPALLLSLLAALGLSWGIFLLRSQDT